MFVFDMLATNISFEKYIEDAEELNDQDDNSVMKKDDSINNNTEKKKLLKADTFRKLGSCSGILHTSREMIKISMRVRAIQERLDQTPFRRQYIGSKYKMPLTLALLTNQEKIFGIRVSFFDSFREHFMFVSINENEWIESKISNHKDRKKEVVKFKEFMTNRGFRILVRNLAIDSNKNVMYKDKQFKKEKSLSGDTFDIFERAILISFNDIIDKFQNGGVNK